MRAIPNCGSSLHALQHFLHIHPQLAQHRDENLVLVLQVVENNLDLLLGLDVDFQIVLGARLGVSANNILSDHDETHKQDRLER